MWNRKRKVYKYYISKMVWVGTEKNLDFRAGPDILDIYERRDSECTKELYERYSHEKVNNTRACYYKPEDTYTYCKYVGDEEVTPQESYDMVKHFVTYPIDKVKSSFKADIKWGIQAIDILVEEKNREIWRLENQADKYTEQYINQKSTLFLNQIKVLQENKLKLQNIYDNICNRKNVKLENKRKEEELISNTLNDMEINCTCGSRLRESPKNAR